MKMNNTGKQNEFDSNFFYERNNAQVKELKAIIKNNPTLEGVEDFSVNSQIESTNNYRNWLCKYKDILVILNDIGSSQWVFVNCINQLVESDILEKKESIINNYKDKVLTIPNDNDLVKVINFMKQNEIEFESDFPSRVLAKNQASFEIETIMNFDATEGFDFTQQLSDEDIENLNQNIIKELFESDSWINNEISKNIAKDELRKIIKEKGIIS